MVGEGALLAALDLERTGRMRDIVATIQAEQDEAIRAPLTGILVVAGGPGTGKTAVALHRAAYLLYSYRKRLGSQGVLLVGPSPIFLRYIDEVLPSLGEDEVVLATTVVVEAGRAAPGPPRRPTSPRSRAIAGWRKVIAAAIGDRERPMPRDVVRRRSTATGSGCGGATRDASSSARARGAATTTNGAPTSPASSRPLPARVPAALVDAPTAPTRTDESTTSTVADGLTTVAALASGGAPTSGKKSSPTACGARPRSAPRSSACGRS